MKSIDSDGQKSFAEAPADVGHRPASGLRRTIGPSGYFTLAFGSIVGSGWVLVLGEWLKVAGPGGSILGFVLGGAVMLLVAACYAELAGRMPRAGGEFRYALEGLGPQYAFAVGWFITLSFASLTAFEGIALAWVLGTLAPNLLGPVLYSFLGADITLGGVVLGVCGATLFGTMNYVGTGVAVRFQSVVTFGFLAIAVGLILAGLILGDVQRIEPLFVSASGDGWMTGAFWIFATAAVFLNGFQAAVYAIEDRSETTGIKGVIFPMILGVLAAVLFYCGIILAASASAPWRELISFDLPAATAFGRLTPGGILEKVVLLSAAISLLKSWNAYVLSGSRLLLAQSRERFLPSWLGVIHPVYGTPTRATLVIFALNVIGVFLGRGAIVPIVNMCAICMTLSFVLSLSVLLRERSKGRPYDGPSVPGGRAVIALALAGVAMMAAVALFEPMVRTTATIPLEWTLIAAWSLVGVVAWFVTGRHRTYAYVGAVASRE